MGLDVTKAVFGVSYKERLKPVCSATETCSKFRYNTFQQANYKGADQTAPLLFPNPHLPQKNNKKTKQVFLHRGHYVRLCTLCSIEFSLSHGALCRLVIYE